MNWFTKYHTGDTTCQLKIRWIHHLIQVNFKTIKQKDHRTLEAKLSYNEPQLTHFKNSSMNITNRPTSRIRFSICPNKEKNTTFENFQIYLNVNYAWRLVQQLNILPTPCSFKGLNRPPADYHLFYRGFWRVHIILPVDSLESLATKVLVCRGSFQKWGPKHYQNLTLVK